MAMKTVSLCRRSRANRYVRAMAVPFEQKSVRKNRITPALLAYPA